MEIPKQKYTEEQIEQIEALVRELLQINEDQNAKLIAMNAKLLNEEKKSKHLQYKLSLCEQFTINQYEK